jgi:hypothetical protein
MATDLPMKKECKRTSVDLLVLEKRVSAQHKRKTWVQKKTVL